MNINIHNTSGGRLVKTDSDIGELANRGPGQVSEADLLGVLRRYNLREGLLTLGRASDYIYHSKDPNNLGRAGHREPQTGIAISQFGLAYLAAMLIKSGANDYNRKRLGATDRLNLIGLSHIYNEPLVQPESVDPKREMDWHGFRSLLVRMSREQLEFQFIPMPLMARSIALYTKIAPKIAPPKFEPLDRIFERETGLQLGEYFTLSVAALVAIKGSASLNPYVLVNAKIDRLRNVLSKEKVGRFLQILSSSYESFREEIRQLNEGLDPIYTKTQLNPLTVRPIVRVDDVRGGDPYVVPNTIAFIKAAFGGLYWHFHRWFEASDAQIQFRNYFGAVFQEYVGTLLRQTYGKEKVEAEIPYGDGKRFIDWTVETRDAIYLFEAKASQFALDSHRTGRQELLAEEIERKVVGAIAQVFARIRDVDHYDELARFRQTKLIPVIVFMDVPLISSSLYQELIKPLLGVQEREKNLPGLSDFECHLLNVEELEQYDSAVGAVDLADVFPLYKGDWRDGFLSVLEKKVKPPLRNRYLDSVYKEFWKIVVAE